MINRSKVALEQPTWCRSDLRGRLGHGSSIGHKWPTELQSSNMNPLTYRQSAQSSENLANQALWSAGFNALTWDKWINIIAKYQVTRPITLSIETLPIFYKAELLTLLNGGRSVHRRPQVQWLPTHFWKFVLLRTENNLQTKRVFEASSVSNHRYL